MSRDWTRLSVSEMTWGERAQAALSFVFAFVIVGAGFVGLCIFVLAPMIDNMDRRSTEHDRCLKRATNGYEIKQCG